MVSRSDLPGISDENSTLRNGIVGCAYVFLVLMIIGAAAPAEDDTQPSADAPDSDAAEQTQAKQTQQQQTQAQTEAKQTKTQANKASGYQVRISYDGEWQGSINADGASRSVDGSGTETFDIDKDNPMSIAANGQKKDDGSGELTVEILKDGEVVSEQSTTAEYGMAQTTHSGL